MASVLPILHSALNRLVPSNSGPFDGDLFEQQVKEALSKLDTKQIALETSQLEAKASQLANNRDELLRLISFIDLTTLAGDDTADRVQKLTDRALHPYDKDPAVQCAAVCVYPARVADVTSHLKKLKQKINVASVAAGFPSGQYHLETKQRECELVVADGATEVDIVISRGVALEQKWNVVYSEVAALKVACGHAHMKTILATGELGSIENVYRASWASLLAGSDFIKTSTGKETVNATPEVAFVMCTAIRHFYELSGRKVGFKPAGGIKTPQEALTYLLIVQTVLGDDWVSPQLFRIGASSLLDNILAKL